VRVWILEAASGTWEMRNGSLRARVRPARTHAADFEWEVVVVASPDLPPFWQPDPLAFWLRYPPAAQERQAAAGDTVAGQIGQRGAEQQALDEAEAALLSATPCAACGGFLDLRNSPYDALPGQGYSGKVQHICSACTGSGYVCTKTHNT
jgi:hypothetical protein